MSTSTTTPKLNAKATQIAARAIWLESHHDGKPLSKEDLAEIFDRSPSWAKKRITEARTNEGIPSQPATTGHASANELSSPGADDETTGEPGTEASDGFDPLAEFFPVLTPPAGLAPTGNQFSPFTDYSDPQLTGDLPPVASPVQSSPPAQDSAFLGPVGTREIPVGPPVEMVQHGGPEPLTQPLETGPPVPTVTSGNVSKAGPPHSVQNAAVSAPETPATEPVKALRIWPVWLLLLPAMVAIWSGWVGLGEMAGFGPVTLLPGISDIEINTAITLPFGMEVYASYALYVWLSGKAQGTALTMARASAVIALVIGALGQVAYHILEAAQVPAAPWWITTIVATIPVAVVGMGAALAHLVKHGSDQVNA